MAPRRHSTTRPYHITPDRCTARPDYNQTQHRNTSQNTSEYHPCTNQNQAKHNQGAPTQTCHYPKACHTAARHPTPHPNPTQSKSIATLHNIIHSKYRSKRAHQPIPAPFPSSSPPSVTTPTLPEHAPTKMAAERLLDIRRGQRITSDWTAHLESVLGRLLVGGKAHVSCPPYA